MKLFEQFGNFIGSISGISFFALCIFTILWAKKEISKNFRLFKHYTPPVFLATAGIFLIGYYLLINISGIKFNKGIFSSLSNIETIIIIALFSGGTAFLLIGKEFFLPKSISCSCGNALPFKNNWKCGRCGREHQKEYIIKPCERCGNELTSIKCPKCKESIKLK